LIETFKFRIGKSQHRVEKEITSEMANSDKSVDQSRFDFDIVRTVVRSEEHLTTRRRIFEKPEPRMNKGTQIWVAAIVDEYLERLQLLRDRLAARKDRIRELKRQLREERQLRNVQSAYEELGKLNNRRIPALFWDRLW
jgi:hypothetical protein